MLKNKEIFFCTVAAICTLLSYMAIDIYLPALPYLKHFFSTTTISIQGSLTVYLVGTMASYLLLGPISDHIGFRKMLLILTLVLLIGSILCAFSQQLWQLYVGRFVQAIAGGGLGLIGRASFVKRFPQKQAMQLFVAIIPTVSVLSPALAPTIGGLILHHSHWQAIFILLAILSLCLFVFSFAFYQFPKQIKSTSKQTISFISVFKTYGTLLKNKLFVLILLIPILLFLIYFLYIAEIPFILHQTGYNSKQIGYAYIPMACSFFSFSLIASRLTKNYKISTIVSLGYLIQLIGLISALILTFTIPNPVISLVIPSIGFLGGIGFMNPVLIGKCLSLHPQNAGYASSLIGAATIIGSAIGTQTVQAVTHGIPTHLILYIFAYYLIALAIFLNIKQQLNH